MGLLYDSLEFLRHLKNKGRFERLKKFLYFPALLTMYLPIAFASQNYEIVSIYSPFHRFGFNGTTRTMSLRDVEAGPQDKNFFLINDNRMGGTIKGSMDFNNGEWYPIYSEGEIEYYPYSEGIQNLIRDRINTYGIARLTFDSYTAKVDSQEEGDHASHT